MDFEYMRRVLMDGVLSVDDMGNCTIIANNDVADTFVLVIKTELGWTEIFEAGPIVPDMGKLPKHTFISYDKLPFSEVQIKKRIRGFLNDGLREITQARIAVLDEARKLLVDFREYL